MRMIVYFAMVTGITMKLALIFTTMTFILANAPYHFNDFQIGLFGIVGLAGVFATFWAKQIADLHNAGHEIILVSSGAVAEGMVRMKLENRPTDLPSLQACFKPMLI